MMEEPQECIPGRILLPLLEPAYHDPSNMGKSTTLNPRERLQVQFRVLYLEVEKTTIYLQGHPNPSKCTSLLVHFPNHWLHV